MIEAEPPKARSRDAGEGGVVDGHCRCLEESIEDLALPTKAWVDHFHYEVNRRCKAEELDATSQSADDGW